MSDQYPAFLIADLVGALTLWLVTRARGGYPLAWSLGAWAATAAVCTGLVSLQAVIPIAALTMIIGVGLITPLVGLIAVIVLLATPVIAARQLWRRWRRRALASVNARAIGPSGASPPTG